MIVGFDFHGVAEKHPNVFKPFMELLRAVGAEVWIISGPSMQQLLMEATKAGYFAGVHFDNLVSVVDYLKNTGVEMWQNDRGSWEADDENWWSSKARLCKMHSVDILVDDSEQYYEYFEKLEVGTRFILLKDCNFKFMLWGIINLFGGG